MTPYRRFALLLLVWVAGAALAFAAGSFWLVRRNLYRETARSVVAAVNANFNLLLGERVFDPAPAPGTGTALAPTPAPSADAAAPAGSSAARAGRLEVGLRRVLRAYGIGAATLYRLDGSVALIYPPGAAAVPWGSLLAGGRTGASYRVGPLPGGGSAETVLVAVRNWAAPGRPVVGYAAVERTMTAELAGLFWPTLTKTGLIALACLLLFFGLRRVYAGSTAALREALGEVEVAYDATISALSAALDQRDTETEDHTLRVAAYSLRLGRELGLPPRRLTALRRGAMLHDIGKIGVPDHVLRSQEALGAAEWRLMREHPRAGAAILAGIPFLADVQPVVLHHHERWDGTGYPDGLAGERIDLLARVFAIVDAYDAITSDRVYRPARSHAEAVAEIRRGAGTQFDPSLVEAFTRVPTADWRAAARGLRPGHAVGAPPAPAVRSPRRRAVRQGTM